MMNYSWTLFHFYEFNISILFVTAILPHPQCLPLNICHQWMCMLGGLRTRFISCVKAKEAKIVYFEVRMSVNPHLSMVEGFNIKHLLPLALYKPSRASLHHFSIRISHFPIFIRIIFHFYEPQTPYGVFYYNFFPLQLIDFVLYFGFSFFFFWQQLEFKDVHKKIS